MLAHDGPLALWAPVLLAAFFVGMLARIVGYVVIAERRRGRSELFAVEVLSHALVWAIAAGYLATVVVWFVAVEWWHIVRTDTAQAIHASGRVHGRCWRVALAVLARRCSAPS